MSQEQDQTELNEQLNNELTKAYIGGLLDGTGSITVVIKKTDDYSFGYNLEPELQLSKKRPHSIQIVDDWAAANGIFGSANKYQERFQFRMNRARDINRFLELVRPYIRDRMEEVDVMLEDVLPLLQENYHLDSKENFIEVVEYVDELKELSVRSKQTSKYNAEFFREEWAEDLED